MPSWAQSLVGGCGLLWADQTQRDDDGYLSTPTERLRASSYAIVSEPLDLVEEDTSGADFLLDDVIGDVRVRASDGDVFIGIAPTSDVEAYLEGVEHHRLIDADFDPSDQATNVWWVGLLLRGRWSRTSGPQAHPGRGSGR